MLNFCHPKIFTKIFVSNLHLAVIFLLDDLEFSDLFDRAIYVNYSQKRYSEPLILYSVSAYGLLNNSGTSTFG